MSAAAGRLRGEEAAGTEREGAEMFEFMLNFLPFLVDGYRDRGHGISRFRGSTLRQAVRTGVTLTSTQVSNNLIDTVMGVVQQHAVGFLNGTSGKAYIKVHYFDQDDPSKDVCADPADNKSGNIIRVSVEVFRCYRGWSGSTPTTTRWTSPTSISVFAADVITPMSSSVRPAIVSAP